MNDYGYIVGLLTRLSPEASWRVIPPIWRSLTPKRQRDLAAEMLHLASRGTHAHLEELLDALPVDPID